MWGSQGLSGARPQVSALRLISRKFSGAHLSLSAPTSCVQAWASLQAPAIKTPEFWNSISYWFSLSKCEEPPWTGLVLDESLRWHETALHLTQEIVKGLTCAPYSHNLI